MKNQAIVTPISMGNIANTEERRLEADQARLDRLNLIGEMAVCIGHEVRNPLTTVRGFLQYFLTKDTFRSYRDQLSLMIDELDRTDEIITDFMSLAKNKAVNPKEQNFTDFLTDLTPILEAEALIRGITLMLEVQDLPYFSFDDKELRQLVYHVVQNSLEALETGGTITIRAYQDRNHIVWELSDNGPGIPDAVMAKLGTPFVTTKEFSVGLGLPLCFRIAERHQAKLNVFSSPNGTTIQLTFLLPELTPAN